jgi:hypothetical protein
MFSHRKRVEEALERDRTAFEAMMEAHERNREEFERNRRSYEDLKTFTRDLTRRNEVVWREVVTELRAGQDRLAGMQAAIADMRDEIRANTQAVLRVLDQMDGGAEPA